MFANGYGKSNINTVDVVALIGIPLFAGYLFGAWEVLMEYLRPLIEEPLYASGGAEITVALLAVVAGIGVLAASGSLTPEDYEREHWYIIVIAMAIGPAYALIPPVQSVFAVSEFVPVVAWLAVSAVSVWISHQA